MTQLKSIETSRIRSVTVVVRIVTSRAQHSMQLKGRKPRWSLMTHLDTPH